MREGYKMTKLGEIPLDWKLIKINEIVDEVTDYVAAGSFASLKENVKVSDIKNFAIYVRLTDLRKGLGHTSQKYVDEKSYKFLSKSNLFGRELLFANIGANVGEVWLMPEIKEKATIAPNMIIIRANNESIIPEYLFAYLTSFIGKRQINKIIAGSGHPKINKTELRQLITIVPPLQEQKKIAEILSTVDEKIDLVQSNIEATQALKKGLMQQLLTKGIGHTEFKASKLGEIPLDWEVVKIGELKQQQVFSKIQDGNHGELHPTASDFVEEGIPFIMANCITKLNQLKIDLAKRISIDQYNSLRIGFTKTNDVLLTHKGTVGLTALIKKEHGNLMLTPQVTLYRIGDESRIIKDYLYYYFQSEIFQKIIDKYSKQSTRAYIGIIAQQKLPIILPSNIQEQKKIAEILSTVDEKLDILQEKKAAYQAMKKGLMQQLLTGQVRVKA
ncbi:restriction endonuclease subunit S [Aureispira sp. CCB-E]|uniref:restriction endonuclease subunit S n=1 Tax=Aureispira sp. CCB-E TaxID=3051121 RepID=UPI00286921A1|nr:restriction endonuclease subunit S [Aureispira sp. CCB-E]WMX16334.1 restriction endonuclease subunit S [Aureispira sp. CCB-E]